MIVCRSVLDCLPYSGLKSQICQTQSPWVVSTMAVLYESGTSLLQAYLLWQASMTGIQFKAHLP